MSRLYFTIVILLIAGVFIAGMAITADSLEELGGKPLTVLAFNNESSYARITLLGKDYEIRLSDTPVNPFSSKIDLRNGLKRAWLYCQDLAFTKTLDLPRLP